MKYLHVFIVVVSLAVDWAEVASNGGKGISLEAEMLAANKQENVSKELYSVGNIWSDCGQFLFHAQWHSLNCGHTT